MTDPRESCPEGWDPAELLAYLEGDLEPIEERKLEEHLKTCTVCSSELGSLRKLDRLLRRHPESFHPEKEELFRLAIAGDDRPERLEAHVVSCPTCQEELEILREMIELRESSSVEATPLPPALAHEFRRIHQSGVKEERSDKLSQQLLGLWHRLFAIPSSLPLLTLGTAAAVVIIAVLAVPLWKTYQEQPIPESVAVPAPPASRPATPPGIAGQAAPQEEGAPLGMSQDSSKYKKSEEEEPRAFEAGNKQTYGKREAGESHVPRSVEGLLKEKARTGVSPLLGKAESPVGAPAPARQRADAPSEVHPGSVSSSPSESSQARDKTSAVVKGDRRRHEKKASPAKPAQLAVPETAKTSVEVRIVNAQGHDMEGITFVPPSNMHFAFHREIEAREKERAPAELGAAALDDHRPRGRIIIKVTEEGGDYDLEGQFFLASSTAPDKIVKIERVTKENLTRSIQDLVSSLVVGR
jgi:hypothetical protein